MRENIKSAIIAILLFGFAFLYITGYKFEYSKTTTKVTPAKVEYTVDDVYEVFTRAYETLDADLVANLYETDAFYLSGKDGIVQGRDSIRPSFKRYFDWIESEGASMTIDFDIKDRTETDSLVVDVAYYLITTTYPEEAKEDNLSAGKFVTVLRKQKNGEWKFRVDAYNPAPPSLFNKAL